MTQALRARRLWKLCLTPRFPYSTHPLVEIEEHQHRYSQNISRPNLVAFGVFLSHNSSQCRFALRDLVFQSSQLRHSSHQTRVLALNPYFFPNPNFLSIPFKDVSGFVVVRTFSAKETLTDGKPT